MFEAKSKHDWLLLVLYVIFGAILIYGIVNILVLTP
jgi:hypothetical protein